MPDIIFYYTIISLSLLNLCRMAAYLVSSDIYSLTQARRQRNSRRMHYPTVSVLIPAHNEELTIERALGSVYNSRYPHKKLEVIIANDGSTDNTAAIVRHYQRTHRDGCRVRLVSRPNRGKAAALNYAIKHRSTGRLVMCLDADSYLAPDAIRKAVQHFRDRNVVALSSNINVTEDGTILSLVQRVEHLIAYQMKKGQAVTKMEYIIGGVGSMFRRQLLEQVNFYDTNTITEDIDLTMKILANKKRKQKIAYAADSIAYTEPVRSLKDLLNQRFRWKFGRSQTFLKHSFLFFARSKRYSRRVSWLTLPYAVLQDLIFLFEPVIVGYFIYLLVLYGDMRTLLMAFVIICVYLTCNIWSTAHLSTKQKLRLTYFTPPMYVLLYILSFAEYVALLKALVKSPTLKSSLRSKHLVWQSPTRG